MGWEDGDEIPNVIPLIQEGSPGSTESIGKRTLYVCFQGIERSKFGAEIGETLFKEDANFLNGGAEKFVNESESVYADKREWKEYFDEFEYIYIFTGIRDEYMNLFLNIVVNILDIDRNKFRRVTHSFSIERIEPAKIRAKLEKERQKRRK